MDPAARKIGLTLHDSVLYIAKRDGGMAKDLDEALTQISAIRSQMARTTIFRGYGPATVGVTAVLAVAAAGVQAMWIEQPMRALPTYLVLWTATAVVSAGLVLADMVTRTRAAHGDLATEMLWTAIEQFVPAAVIGGLVTLLLQSISPESAWLLPALWQIFVAMGVFASLRFLPPATFWVGAWYLLSGLAALVFARDARALSPVTMAAGFGVGQLLTAAILYRHREETGADVQASA